MKIDIACKKPQFNYQYTCKDHGIVGVYGISGSGKSSLLDAIAGYNDDAFGKVTFNQQTLIDSQKQTSIKKCNYMQQYPVLFPHWNIEKNLEFALRYSDIKTDFRPLLQHLECLHLLKKFPHELSGGEKQRIAFVRSLIQIEPNSVLLLDEPFNALDLKTRHKAWYLLSKHKNDVLIFIATHDLDEIYQYADRFIYINNGHIDFHNDMLQTMTSGYADLPLASRPFIDENTIVYADDVSIGLERNPHSSITHQIAVNISHINKLGASVIVTMQHKEQNTIKNTNILAKITEDSLKTLQLKPQQQVFACFKASSYTIQS